MNNIVEPNKLILNNISRPNSYSNKDFFKDIKRAISKFEGRKINYKTISLNYLGKKNKWFINDRMRRSKTDPDWRLNSFMINRYEKTLKLKLKKYFCSLEPFFKKYRGFNLEKRKTREYSDYTINYFDEINTKRKMYWFCWFLAEGSFTSKSFRITINPKDGILLKWLIRDLRINPNWVYFYHSYYPKTKKNYKSLVLELSNKDFVDNLRRGAFNLYPRDLIWESFLIGKKSYKIRFPRFASKEILMSGVLGFFDGDGTHSGDTARIGNIMSKKFLEDIVEVFDLKYTKPKPHHENGKIRGYYLPLGGDFFNDLLLNYDRSLPRKRRKYERPTYQFPLRRNQLQELVYQNPGKNGYELAKIIHRKTGIKVGARTVYDKLADPNWNIEKLTLDEYYGRMIINLCKKGWDLKEIWTNTDEGLGFNISSWSKNTGRFFKRIFKSNPLIMNKSGSFKERIEDTYKPSK